MGEAEDLRAEQEQEWRQQHPDLPALPMFVRTKQDRERWAAACQLAIAISEHNEQTGVSNPRFVFFAARSFYFSDMPTGEPSAA